MIFGEEETLEVRIGENETVIAPCASFVVKTDANEESHLNAPDEDSPEVEVEGVGAGTTDDEADVVADEELASTELCSRDVNKEVNGAQRNEDVVLGDDAAAPAGAPSDLDCPDEMLPPWLCMFWPLTALLGPKCGDPAHQTQARSKDHTNRVER